MLSSRNGPGASVAPMSQSRSSIVVNSYTVFGEKCAFFLAETKKEKRLQFNQSGRYALFPLPVEQERGSSSSIEFTKTVDRSEPALR
jgi:hypothetical protein